MTGRVGGRGGRGGGAPLDGLRAGPAGEDTAEGLTGTRGAREGRAGWADRDARSPGRTCGLREEPEERRLVPPRRGHPRGTAGGRALRVSGDGTEPAPAESQPGEPRPGPELARTALDTAVGSRPSPALPFLPVTLHLQPPNPPRVTGLPPSLTGTLPGRRADRNGRNEGRGAE